MSQPNESELCSDAMTVVQPWKKVSSSSRGKLARDRKTEEVVFSRFGNCDWLFLLASLSRTTKTWQGPRLSDILQRMDLIY